MFDPKLCPPYMEDYFWRKAYLTRGGCLEWQGRCYEGTPMHWLSKKFKFPTPARRIAWCFYNQKTFPVGAQARTTCGNSRCILPKHIRLVLKEEDGRDLRHFYRSEVTLPQEGPSRAAMAEANALAEDI